MNILDFMKKETISARQKSPCCTCTCGNPPECFGNCDKPAAWSDSMTTGPTLPDHLTNLGRGISPPPQPLRPITRRITGGREPTAAMKNKHKKLKHCCHPGCDEQISKGARCVPHYNLIYSRVGRRWPRSLLYAPSGSTLAGLLRLEAAGSLASEHWYIAGQAHIKLGLFDKIKGR